MQTILPYLIERTSTLTGKTHNRTIEMTKVQFAKIEANSELMQNILPNHSAEDREFLISGITPEEWDKEFNQIEE